MLIHKASLESSCSGRVNGYIIDLGDTSLYIITDSILFADYLSGLTSLNGEEVKVGLDSRMEVYAVVNWATFAGRLNRDLVEWESLLDTMSAHHQISVIRLNLDLQKFWGDDPEYTGLLKLEDFEQ